MTALRGRGTDKGGADAEATPETEPEHETGPEHEPETEPTEPTEPEANAEKGDRTVEGPETKPAKTGKAGKAAKTDSEAGTGRTKAAARPKAAKGETRSAKARAKAGKVEPKKAGDGTGKAGAAEVKATARPGASGKAGKAGKAAGSGAAGKPAAERSGPGGAWFRTPRLILLVLGLIVVTIGVASTVLYARLAAPQRFDETAAREGLQAAPGYVERVISYDYRTLERDVGDARKNLTGTFLGEYDKSMAKVTPTLVSQQAIQEAKVVKAGIQEASADEVSVLIFSQRMTTKLDRDEPLVYQDRILVTLTKVGDRWLISQMRYLV